MRVNNLPALAVLTVAVSFAAPSLVKAQSAAAIHGKLQRTENSLSKKREKAGVLSTDIASYTAKMHTLAGPLAQAQARFNVVETAFQRELADLKGIQAELRVDHKRQAILNKKLAHGRAVVSQRLVALYKSGGTSDLLSVVLNSRNFGQVIEREEFIRRITVQDKDLIVSLKVDKAAVDALAIQVASQESRQQRVTGQLQQHKDEIDRTRLPLLRQQEAYDAARGAKQQALTATKESIGELEHDAAKLHADEAAISGSLQQAGSSVSFTGLSGNATLIWPVNGPVTSPYGPRVLNGTAGFHPGLDIGAAEGTPIKAAAAGVVALMQPTGSSGGFGNFTCIQHTSSMSTCYAHQSSFATFVGAHVSQGQVIGYVGNTGFSFGAHLDLEVRINGSPVNPLNYL